MIGFRTFDIDLFLDGGRFEDKAEVGLELELELEVKLKVGDSSLSSGSVSGAQGRTCA